MSLTTMLPPAHCKTITVENYVIVRKVRAIGKPSSKLDKDGRSARDFNIRFFNIIILYI